MAMTARARRAAVLLGSVLALLLAVGAPRAAAADFALTDGCFPPNPPADANCAGWHTSALTLRWTWNQLLAHPTSGNCSEQTFSTDTNTAVTCEVGDGSGQFQSSTVAIKVDVTAPTVTGATPDRPPDSNGWWNHPVTFAFAGTDATSGIASCDSVTYGGPDGANAQVPGSCHDVAGNSTAAAFPLKYDATPPSVTDVVASAADKSVTVTWKPSADVTRTELTRSAGSGAPTTFVFSGATSTFTDAGLANGTAYDYTVKVFDDAGNSASAGTRAIPFLLAPAAAGSPQGRTGAPPLLRWHRVRGARYYNVQLFRGRKKILSAWPARPRFQLDKTWKFHGHRYRLARGRYRWYAWPGFGPRAARHYGRLIRTGTFYFKP